MAGIDLEKAREITRAVLAKGAEMGLKPLSVAVLDTGGHLIMLERSDGANAAGPEIARSKGRAAVMMHMGGKQLKALSQDTSWFMPSMREACHGQVFPAPGAVLVRDSDGTVVGGLGVSGDAGANDAACAVAALASVGLVGED
ncbi:heme-binding protein [Tropicimonas sp. TH_r6]|uniref:GlcG/HbpS family heme-binding protein n=1 Tax=Tropicimonas sp. TH_r6 TaxID=3082085 RepID=UPI0029553493|nr:heme-binding protein [Tropicimonas sp. TH_r6]MDV7145372.1 heme-binding protein [Tropicimonas sp. TH_r6]